MTAVDERAATVIGRAVPNMEWADKTSGAARYAGDVTLPGMLHAAVCRSPHPSARIEAIDVAAVAARPGVVATLTAADLPDRRYIHHGGPLSDRRVLASGIVRYVGEEVAAVAAETLTQARDAAAAIEVAYRPLPAATSLDAARRDGAPKVHERAEGNVSLGFHKEFGEPAATDVSVSATYRFGRQNHACMETNTIVASWSAEARRLEVWVSTQAPHFVVKELSHVLDLRPEQVVVHQVAVGGGFGSKSKISEYEAIAAALSMKANRPVRLALTREEEFATTKSRHRFEIALTTGATADGTLTGRRAELTVENGAYNHSGPSVMGAATGVIASLYRVPHVEYAAKLVYTNTHPGGQFRGYGNPQATFAIESQMDELADRLGIDPIELRLRNVNRPGDVTHAGYRLGSADLAGCLEAARDAIGWTDLRRLGGTGRGVGIATAIQVSGAYVYPDANRSSATIEVDEDGGVLVRFGGADAGTGQRTILAQIAAAELGVPVDRVDVLMMESAETPPDLGAWSSRGTYMGGHAVRTAARAAADRLRERAAAEAGVDPSAVTLTDGRLVAGDRSWKLGELVALTGPLSVTEEYLADVEELDHHTGTGNISGAYSFAAQAVEVEVDRRTGRVRVVRVVAVHDSGRVVNPLLAEGQVVGGVTMGLGAALGEELLYTGGRMVNPSYLNYPVPRAADAPPVTVLFVGGDDPKGPYGAKGLGEIVIVPTVAAVANAVAHATGVRVREAPLTPDRVLSAIRAAEGGGARRRSTVWRRPGRWGVAAMRRAYPLGVLAAMEAVAGRRPPAKADPPSSVTTPREIDGVTQALRDNGSVPLAGGTDLLPAVAQGVRAATRLVDVTLVPEMGRVEGRRIGAAVRLADLESAAADRSPEGVLAETVRSIASAQIREMATVGGNLCQQNRCWFYRNDFPCYKRSGAAHPCYAVTGEHRFYHAAMGAHRCQAVTPSDLATTLAALDAVAIIEGGAGGRAAGASGRVAGATRGRRVPVAAFYTGPGETVLRPGELLTAVEIPAAATGRVSAFEKLGLWAGDFALASACASLGVHDGAVVEARVVLGGIAPTPVRARRVERALVAAGSGVAGRLPEIADRWTTGAHPLPGTAWKVHAATGLLVTALERCLGEG